MAALESVVGIQEPVQATIWYALNNYLHEDAVFLAERLHTEVCSLDSAYLLATCYYRSGRVQQAKHLLAKAKDLANTANTVQCNLLYAKCCLDLKDYKSGLIALNGLLCVHDFSEADLATRYGADAGVAFWLLGELNSHLNQTKEAAKFFKAALKYNPFLWTAYQSLCELGEFVDPKDYFKVSDYPSFLNSSVSSLSLSSQPSLFSHSAPPSSNSSSIGSMENEVDLVCTEQSEMDTGSTGVGSVAVMGGASSAFTSVESKSTVTPNLYGNPAVGSAVASSTPTAARSLTFGSSGREGQTALSVDLTGKGSMPAFNNVRAALMFSGSSAGGSSQPSGHMTDMRSHMTGRPLPPAVTPLAPSFGVLSFDTPAEPGSSAHKLHSPSKLLDFSRMTPSPTPSPVATSKLSFTPAPVSHPLMVSASIEKLQTRTANQNGESVSHAEATTPPGAVGTPNLFKVPAAPKSEAPLRRSTRLRNTSKGRLSEHAIHSTRTASKSRLKSPTSNRKTLTDMPKKGTKVSFNTPLNAHNLATQSSAVTSPKSQSPKSTSPLRPSAPLRENREERGGGHRRKDPSSMAAVVEGESIGGRGEVKVDQLQAMLSQQLTQHKRAALSGLASLLHLMEQIASAYQALCSYELGKAIRLFRSLPSHHRETAWVKGQVARAYFAGERFKKCAQIYREVHHSDPHRQEGMDLYASSLWHLQREVELSVVAESLYSSNKLRPESLCAMATVMNLSRNHEGAIKFLTRAIQIAPRFSYAHSLLGHEYWITKDYDKALSSFQDAVTVNPRQYNAWYGMAHVHYAQEKYKFAESYATRALSVNRCSSIACTQLALAQFRQGNLHKALHSLSQAIAINSSNPIPRFHRAKVLEAIGKPEEALAQLDILTSEWPKEPELYISKGKILKSLNRNHEAVLQFSWALDFSQSVPSSHIREQIDQVYHEHTSHRVDQLDDSDFDLYPDPDDDDADLDDSSRSVEQEAGSDESMIS